MTEQPTPAAPTPANSDDAAVFTGLVAATLEHLHATGQVRIEQPLSGDT